MWPREAWAIGRVDVVLLSHDQHADNLDPAGRDVVAAAPLTLTTLSGDNAALSLVEDIACRIGPVDIALLFAGAARTSLFDGAPLTLTSAGAVQAGQLLGARWVVPLHIRGCQERMM